MKTALIWLVGIILLFTGIIAGIFICHALVYSKFEPTALAQIFATVLIPFLYFLAVEVRQQRIKVFADLVTNELNSVVTEMRTVFDVVGALHVAGTRSYQPYGQLIPAVSNSSLRLKNLASSAVARGDRKVSQRINTVHRFVEEFSKHLITASDVIRTEGYVTDAHLERFMAAYAHIIYNQQITILYVNGILDPNASLIKAPESGLVT